jgi:lysozyme
MNIYLPIISKEGDNMNILGVDISHWEDNPDTPKKIDFNMMKAAGAQFCIFKASQAWKPDLVFQISWADCKGILPRGAYHYLDYTKTGLDQAKYFCDLISKDPPEIPPIVDYECKVNIPTNANGQLWNFLTYVEVTTHRVPIIYSSPDYWKNYGTPAVGWKKYPLWIANYQVTKPFIPAPWLEWKFWQYTDKGDGHKYGVEALGIDLNYYNGTYEQLQAFCNIAVPPPVLTLEQRVAILEREAKKLNWNLNP